MVIEPRAGGRWYEIGNDGAEQDWGKVVACEAPDRLLLIWSLNGEWAYDPDFETTVEVRFTADGDHTIVDFEHRDLDRYRRQCREGARRLRERHGRRLGPIAGRVSGGGGG